MNDDSPGLRPSFTRAQRLGAAWSVAWSLLAVLALAGMANYLAVLYAPRLHWGATGTPPLSPLSLRVLGALTNEVRVTVFFSRTDPAYPAVRALLREYEATSPRVRVREIDYPLDPAAAQAFRREHQLDLAGDRPDLVLFDSGGFQKVVYARELSEFDTGALLRGEVEVRPVAFRGEPLFTSALHAVIEGRPRRVCFVTGHREFDPAGDAPQAGFRQFADLMAQDNARVETLNLAAAGEVPRDCELLVLAGPQDPFTARELAALDGYLRRGGRVLVLLRSRAVTGLEPLLAEWGVSAPDSLVLDPANTEGGLLQAGAFGAHPITRPLRGSRLLLVQPRLVAALEPAGGAGALARADGLVLTGTNAVAATTFTRGAWRVAPGSPRGELSLAVAVEKGALPGVAAAVGTTRLVVTGDATFLANGVIDLGANRDFAVLAVNWLLDRSPLLAGVPPRPVRSYQVVMSPAERRTLRWLLLGVLPGGVLLLGALVWWRRR
ncbi:MAG: GldG family protein [Limisphaerales bacterium]